MEQLRAVQIRHLQVLGELGALLERFLQPLARRKRLFKPQVFILPLRFELVALRTQPPELFRRPIRCLLEGLGLRNLGSELSCGIVTLVKTTV